MTYSVNSLLLAAAGNAGGQGLSPEGLYASVLYENPMALQNTPVVTGVPVFAPEAPTITTPYTFAAAYSFISETISVNAGDFLIVFIQNLFNPNGTLAVDGITITPAQRRSNAFGYNLAVWIHKFETGGSKNYQLTGLDPGIQQIILVRGATNAELRYQIQDYPGISFTTSSFASNGSGFLFASDRDPGLTATATNGTLISALSVNENFFSNRAWRIDNASGTVPSTTVTWSSNTFNGDWCIVDAFNGARSDGLVILRARATGISYWVDTLRGKNAYLTSNSTAAQNTNGDVALTTWNSTGFTISSSATLVNASTGGSYGAVAFKKEPGFFDVLTYTGDGLPRTIAHSLGYTPGMIIVKPTSATGNWIVWHRSMTPEYYYVGNLNTNQISSAAVWNNTAPTSSGFSVGASSLTNAVGTNYVAYIFGHSDDGKFPIFCGSYTANASFTNGPEVSLPFELQTLITRPITGGASAEYATQFLTSKVGLSLRSNVRSTLMGVSSVDSLTGNGGILVKRDGFKINDLLGGNYFNGATYVFLAVRELEKEPTSGAEVFQPIAYTANNIDGRKISTTIFPDSIITRSRDQTTPSFATTLFAGADMAIYFVSPQSTNGVNDADTIMNATADAIPARIGPYALAPFGYGVGNDVTYKLNNGGIQISWVFKKSTKCFDCRFFTRTAAGTPTVVKHGLGVAPEMIWVKGYWNYDLGAPMYVYAAPLGAGQSLRIDTTGAATADTTTWNNTAPTAEEFQFNRGNVSGGAPEYYRAWLFATLPGISKVGTYIGNGSEVTVDCGFSTGARFILIKASSGTGDWFVFDSARGIVAGTGLDPALRLNITSAEITNTNYVGTHPSGFQVFNAAVNTSGTTYLFFAMA